MSERIPRGWLATLLGALLWAAFVAAQAKIDFSTLPERGEVELTIYNAADLTLVKERRAMSFRQGLNPLQFSWANTLIDPTSVHLRVVEGEAWLEIEDIAYPANTANTLVWSLHAEEAGEGVVEISYFTSGIAWEADYVAIADRAEQALDLEGYVRVTNNSGEDYLNAKTRLLVGEVNLVEAIATLSRGTGTFQWDWGTDISVLGGELQEKGSIVVTNGVAVSTDYLTLGDNIAPGKKEVAKEGVSEYFLLTIEGREDLEDGLSKRLPSFQAEGVPFDLTYVHDPRRFGPGIAKLYKLANEAPEEQPDSPLGQSPLPGGFYQVFREAATGGLAYLGRHDERYVPVGEELEINLGQDGLIAFEDARRRYKRLDINYSPYGDVHGWDDLEEREIVLRNSKREAVPVEIRRGFDGDFDFEPAEPSLWEKISETEWELKAEVPPMSEARFAYALRTRQGANARK